MKESPLIYTIGHSTRDLWSFIRLLGLNGIKMLVDVRTVPKSKFNPQYNITTLPQSLAEAGINYRHLPGLGGLRHSKLRNSPNTGWRLPSFRNYADHMMTEEFSAALGELIVAAEERPTVMMCAEAVPWRCHRNLIADALTVRGFRVIHIIGENRTQEHALTPWALVSEVQITYPALDEGPRQT